jgi:WWE domain
MNSETTSVMQNTTDAQADSSNQFSNDDWIHIDLGLYNKKMEELKAELSRAVDEKTKVEESLNRIQMELYESNCRISQLETVTHDIVDLRNDLEQKYFDAKKTVNELECTINDFIRDNADLKKENDRLNKECVELVQENDRVNKENDRLNKECVELVQENDRVNKEYTKFKKNIKEEVAKILREQGKYKEEIANMLHGQDKYKIQLQEAANRHNTQIQQADEQHNVILAEHECLKTRCEKLEIELEKAREVPNVSIQNPQSSVIEELITLCQNINECTARIESSISPKKESTEKKEECNETYDDPFIEQPIKKKLKIKLEKMMALASDENDKAEAMMKLSKEENNNATKEENSEKPKDCCANSYNISSDYSNLINVYRPIGINTISLMNPSCDIANSSKSSDRISDNVMNELKKKYTNQMDFLFPSSNTESSTEDTIDQNTQSNDMNMDDDISSPSSDSIITDQYYYFDNGSWEKYDNSVNNDIINAEKLGLAKSLITINNVSYTIDFTTMTQINTTTKNSRRIRKNSDPEPLCDVRGMLYTYDYTTAINMMNTKKSGASTYQFVVNGTNYEINFNTMVQRNLLTNFERKIIMM